MACEGASIHCRFVLCEFVLWLSVPDNGHLESNKYPLPPPHPPYLATVLY